MGPNYDSPVTVFYKPKGAGLEQKIKQANRGKIEKCSGELISIQHKNNKTVL